MFMLRGCRPLYTGSSSSTKKASVVIIGGGPAGLTAAIYAARADLKPLVLAGSFGSGSLVPGGQLMITTEVENFPGFPKGIEGPTLMAHMREQAQRFGADIVDQFVESIGHEEDTWRHFACVGDQKIYADSIIIATGASARWLGAEREDELVNKGISACATCDGPLPVFRNGRIFVVGGGDSAVEEAVFLAKFASHVTLVVRRGELRASKAMQKRLAQCEKVSVRWFSNIVRYVGDQKLTAVVLRDSRDGSSTTLPAEGVFMAIGHDPSTGFLKGSRVELDSDGYVATKDLVGTNVEGIFAAGDCHDKHFRQAISAAGFGCMAALAAERYVTALPRTVV